MIFDIKFYYLAAAKDTARGMNTGWERFDFNKDAALDDDDEIEGWFSFWSQLS